MALLVMELVQAGEINPAQLTVQFIDEEAIQRLSLPPLKDIYTGNPFWNTFLIRILAAFTTSILDSHRFIAIFSPRISDR